MMKKIFSIAICLLMLHGSAFAVAANPDLYCPHQDEIQKNQITQKWNAQNKYGTWKSYQTSFATNLIQFVGAQWVGAAVGQLTCIYKSEQRFTEDGNLTIQPALPVMIVFYALTHQPAGGKWKHIGHGVYNCDAQGQKNCPFKMRLKHKVQDIYKEAESLKTSNTDLIQPESY